MNGLKRCYLTTVYQNAEWSTFKLKRNSLGGKKNSTTKAALLLFLLTVGIATKFPSASLTNKSN